MRAVLRRLAALCAAAALALGGAGCGGAQGGVRDAASALLSEAASAYAAQEAQSEAAAQNAPAQSEAAPQAETEAAPQPEQTAGGFKMHFIDVGQALSVLIECDGQYMLYDGGNADDGSGLVSYLQQHGVQQLAAMFCSHAHEDHVGGLSAVLAAIPTAAIYSPTATAGADNSSFAYFAGCAAQLGYKIEVPAVGAVWQLGEATLELLGPVKSYDDNVNDTSLVLRVEYKNTSFLLTGDMEYTAEYDLIDSGAALKADVLQVGHHGSYTSTSYVFLNEVMPEIAVISCGANNDYGHPHEEVLSRLSDEGAAVYRTDQNGTVVIASDGAALTVSFEQTAADAAQSPASAAGSEAESEAAAVTGEFIGNKKSLVYHSPSCENLPAQHNRVYFSTTAEAEAAGFRPCGGCKPAG